MFQHLCTVRYVSEADTQMRQLFLKPNVTNGLTKRLIINSIFIYLSQQQYSHYLL